MSTEINKSQAQKLRNQILSVSKSNLSEEDFYSRLNDEDYARGVYKRLSGLGEKPLGASDESSFLDSLKVKTNADKMSNLMANANEDLINNNLLGPQVDSVKPTINKDANTNLTIVDKPTPQEKLNLLKDRGQELLDNNIQSSKDSVLPVGPRQNVVGQMPETPAEQIIKNNEPKKVEGEVNQIGQDKVADAALTDNLLADVDARLTEWHKLNDAFIDEYESKMAPKAYEDRMVYGEHYVPKGGIFSLFRNKEAEENQKFIDANSAKYQDLIRQRNAIIRTKETAETMKQYADYDRQVAVGEQMSSMVDKGELSEADMKELRGVSNEQEKNEALTRMYNQGRISEDTFKKILDLGDTSDKSGLAYGLFKTGKIEDFVSLGLTELSRNTAILDIINRYNQGLPINSDEQTLLNVYSKLMEVKSEDRDFWFGVGMGLQQSLQFVLESMVTGGVGSAASSGKWLGSAFLKRMAQNAGRQALLTPVTPTMYNDFTERVINMHFTQDEVTGADKMKALYKSYVGTFAERFSETLGNIVGEAHLVSRLLNNKTTRKFMGNAFETMSKIANNPVYKTTADILAAGGITDIPGEIASEYSGNIINSIFTLDAEGLAEIFNPEFLGQVALQSVLMGGMGNVVSFGAGSAAAVLENRKVKKEYEKEMNNLANAHFDNPALESLKEELATALENKKILGDDGLIESGDMQHILSQIKDEYARTEVSEADKNAMRAVDNAIRIGTYRFGQDQTVMALVEGRVGEYLNADGNVYEFADAQGNNYFILQSTEDATIIIDRNTGEKQSIANTAIPESNVIKTDGAKWAMNQYLANIDVWNKEDAVPYQQQPTFTPADKIEMDGVLLNVVSYNSENGRYTVVDENGKETEVDPNDEGVTPIYSTTMEQTPQAEMVEETAEVEEPQQEVVEQVENDIDNNPINAEQNSEGNVVEENEIEYDSNGDPVWSSISVERGKQEIDSVFDEDEAKAYVADKVKEAEKAVKKLENKKPKATNLRDRKAEIEQIKKDKETAQANLEYWNSMTQLYTAPVTEEIVEQPVEQIYQNTSDNVLPEGVQPYTPSQEIVDRYNNAPKAYGAEDTYTDADGNTYKGRWVVVEAEGVTPSHDPNTLQTSEGFPLTDKGRNVNDNDYSTKRGIVETMAANYDSRALDEPVLVSNGVVVSGNNRTIGRQLAAQKGTDAKYTEALPKKAEMRGVSAEELGKFKNPSLVFELTEPIEYTTENFARFNRARNKTKSPVDMAIAIGKQDTSRLVGQILSTIGEVEKLSELYQNQNTVAAIMKQIVESGIINQNEMPQFYTKEYGITDAGKDFIETLLVGSVINEDQIRILNSEGMKQYREKIVSAMLPIANNMKYEDNIGKHLNTAIKYLKEARDAKTDLKGILLDIPLFDAKEYEDLSIFTALMLQRKPTEFREFINNLNQRLELGADNLFGETNNAESVLKDYEQQNKLTDNERETIRLAEQARESATQSVSGSVQTDGTDTDTRGEGVDGSSIPETEKQSVENGNIEQSGYDNLDESIGNGETGRRGGESDDTGSESYQQPMGGTAYRGASPNIGGRIPTEEARIIATNAIVETLKESGIKVNSEVESPIEVIKNAEYHKVYHGTGAKFDKFDHSHMGEGEGNQAFGWGSYVTEVEGIGRTYAKDIARNGKRVYLDGNDITDLIPKVPSSIHSPSVFAAAFMLRYKDDARNAIEEHLKGLNTTFSSISEQSNPKLYNAYKQAIQTAEEALKVIDNSKFEVKETTPTLYTIDIPDDNGSNYLYWSEVIEEEDLEKLLEKISNATKESESFDFDEFSEQLHKLSDYGNILGEDLYFTLSRHGYGTNHKAASQLLSKIGFIGVSYPAQFRTGGRADGAKNYVIFNENDLQIKDRIEFMKTPNGTIYGWTVGGEIFLTKDGFNPDTPIHEYTHIWANAMKQKNPKGWASIKNLLKDTPVWNEVVNDENYSNIRNNEDSVASEVLSRISGKENAKRMEAEAQKMIDETKGNVAKAKVQELINRVKKAVEKFWNWVGTELFKIENFDSVEQVADRILYDLLNKTDLSSATPSTNTEMHIVGRPAGYSTNDLEMTDKDKLLHSIQDRMRPVKKLMDEIISRGGKISENADPYSQEFLASSRAAAEIEDFKNEKYEPLANAIAEAMKVLSEERGWTAEEARKAVDDYLYARHAPERNKQICVNEMVDAGMKVIAPKDAGLVDDVVKAEIRRIANALYDNQFKGGKNVITPRGVSKEQAKVVISVAGAMQKTALEISKEQVKDEVTGQMVLRANNRSGMSDAVAEMLMNSLYTPTTKAVLDEVSARVKDCTDFTLDKWLEYGLISKEDYNSYKNQYEYYIPLRGWDERGEDIDYMTIPSKQFNQASELINLNRQAKGRSSKAADPLAHIASLAQSACVTGNKNLIRQMAFRMVEQNEGIIADLAVIENTYELYDEEGNIIGYSKRKPSQKMFDQGRVKLIRNTDYRWHKTGSELGAHRVPVMFDGVEYMVYFKGEIGALAATAINGTDRDTRNVLTRGLSVATRFISSNLTAKNVYFLGKNLARDLGFGNFAYFIENGALQTMKLNKYFVSAMRTAAMDAMGADKASYKDADLYEEFKLNGGQTGYVQLESIDKLSKQMNKLIKDAAADRGYISQEAVNAKDLLIETFDVLGKASENAMRFAVYKLEREKGSSAREAAIRAKEITVNFNRQGVNTKGWSAVYAFFNPAVQGAYRYAKLAKENPGRFISTVSALAAIKFGLGMICEMFSGGGDDEPKGESAYDRLSDYVKATNWVIPLGAFSEEGEDKFLCIPLPQSVRGTTHIADLAVDVIYGKKDFGTAVKDFAMFNVGEFLPFDIDAIDLTGDNPWGTIMQAASPTVLRPVVENVINRDFMGNPISKEPYVRSQDYIPQYQLAFRSTSPLLVGTSKMLNELAGGDEKRSAKYQISQNGQIVETGRSILDVNPAKIEHLFSGYFGGMFKPMLDVWDTMRSVTDKDVKTDVSSVALVNQFIKGPTSKPGYKMFYRLRDEAQMIEDVKNLYKDDYLNKHYVPLLSNGFNIEIANLYDIYSGLVKTYNENIMLLNNNKDSVEGYAEKVKELEKYRDQVILDAAIRYREICENRDNSNKEE